MASGSTWSSEPSSNIYYAAYGRLDTNKSPVFTCSSNNLYTATTSNKGNKSLSSPIGLITADEVIYGGFSWSESTTNNYLYTGQYYWTMSPLMTDSYGDSGVFLVDSDGWLSSSTLYGTHGVRPVINISPNVTITGSGTIQDPYVVV